MNSLADPLTVNAGQQPERPAIFDTRGKHLSFSRLAAQVGALAKFLRDEGIPEGARIGLLMPGGVADAAACLAASLHGVCAPLDAAATGEELAQAVHRLRLDCLLAAPADLADRQAPGFDPAIPVLPLPAATLEAGDLLAESSNIATIPRRRSGAEIALLLATSGTTSEPKTVELTHRQILASCSNIARVLKLQQADRCLNVLPRSHVHGLIGALLAPLSAGSAVILGGPEDMPRFLDLLREAGPTWYTAVPALHREILSQTQHFPRRPPEHSLRLIRSASSPLPAELMQALEATFGAPVIESYGMTEAATQITSNPLPPRARKPGSAGLPAGPELKILNHDGRDAGVREPGEVLIRGESVITAYGNGSAPSSAFADGWLRTGDLGYLDEDGYLFLTGRSRDLIDRGGIKVAPREIEEALLRLPRVREAAVFGIPHPRLGEDVAAVVVADCPGSVSVAELRKQLLASLSSFKVPSRIREVDAIPLSPTGKRRRSDLAALLAPEDGQRPANGARGAELATRIAKTWASVLGVENVGIEDNFFALGGDSLQAGRVIARLRVEIGEEVRLRALLENPTPAGLAASLQQKAHARAD